MPGFWMKTPSGKHWRVWSSRSEKSWINIRLSKCTARVIDRFCIQKSTDWGLENDVIGNFEGENHFQCRIAYLPNHTYSTSKRIINLWSWKTCFDLHSWWSKCFRSKMKNKKKPEKILVQLLGVPSCLRVLPWFHMVLLIPLHKDLYLTFQPKEKTTAIPWYFGFQSWGPINSLSHFGL